MDLSEQKIINFLLKLGLTAEEAKIYLTLTYHGILTILELSRKTTIPRTSLYRKLEHLKTIGVIQELIAENTTKIKATEPNKLDLLVKEKEILSNELRLQFPNFSSELLQITKKQQPDTKVLFYKGIDGIKQMIWNVLRTKDKFQGYTYRCLESVVGEKFTEEWSFEFVKRGLFGRDIHSDEFLKSRQEFPQAKNANWSTWKSRYISPKILNINHQLDIYNDVVSFYNWHEGEVFGVEIYNEKVATLQKQIFEMLWAMAEEPEAALKRKEKEQKGKKLTPELPSYLNY